tara:strand:+ start:282 stop:1094 length:813 start_codon:yes stop_codon:yes gene_type:complete
MNLTQNKTLYIYVLLYFAFLYIPVMFLPIFSFNSGIHMSFPLQGFSTEHYEDMWNSPKLFDALYNSIYVGVVSSLIATMLAFFAAKAFTKYKFRGHSLSYGAILTPFLIPEIILAIALLVIWVSVGLPLGLTPIIIGHVLFCTPFCMIILIARMEGFDNNLEEASQDLGEGLFMTFWRVSFPILLPGLIAAFLLGFIISFDEFLLAMFLQGSDQTLPIYMWGQLRFARRLPHVLALGAVIIVATSLIVMLAYWLRNVGQPQEKQDLTFKI